MLKIKGYDYGPRKELIKEFEKETGFLFLSFTTETFIRKFSPLVDVNKTDSLREESIKFSNLTIAEDYTTTEDITDTIDEEKNTTDTKTYTSYSDIIKKHRYVTEALNSMPDQRIRQNYNDLMKNLPPNSLNLVAHSMKYSKIK